MGANDRRRDKFIGIFGLPNTPMMKSFAVDATAVREEDEGNKNSGNWGHKGRPGQVGGSGGGGGSSGGGSKSSSKKSSSSSSQSTGSSGSSKFAGKTYKSSPGKATKNLGKGSGTTVISGGDIRDEGKHSIQKWLREDGTMDPKREELHSTITDGLFEGVEKPKPGEQQVFTLMGGGPAAGKSTVLDDPEFGLPTEKQAARIDSDGIKGKLPEYGQMVKAGDASAAGFAHEESSALAKRAMAAGRENGYNVLLDGTGDGSEKSLMKKINEARDAGMKVEGCYVTCPTETALERAIARGQRTGRVVDPMVIKKTHAEVSRLFPKVASEFDHIRLFDTNVPKGSKPKLIAECFRGQEIQVFDPDLYDAFLKKAET